MILNDGEPIRVRVITGADGRRKLRRVFQDARYIWVCCGPGECYAPDEVQCDCGGSLVGHDPGDEDRS